MIVIAILGAITAAFYLGYFAGCWISRVAIDDAQQRQAVADYRRFIKSPVPLPKNWGEG